MDELYAWVTFTLIDASDWPIMAHTWNVSGWHSVAFCSTVRTCYEATYVKSWVQNCLKVTECFFCCCSYYKIVSTNTWVSVWQ